MRLLAVDDDPLILDLLPIVFTQAGLPEITVAPSPAAALDLIATPGQIFDGLILDIEMPGMNGIDLCRQVRRLPAYRHTPIIMLSASADDRRIEQAFRAGADDYITKPFDVKDIASRLRVAERMAARSPHAPLLDRGARHSEGAPGDHGFGLEDPLRIAGARQLILPFALGNYLSQLSRRRLDSCTIFAARLDHIGSLYAGCKSHEYARMFGCVVSAIAEEVGSPDLLMAYEGDGMFMCITQGAEPVLWPNIESQIERALRQTPFVYDNGRVAELSLCVGNPIMPNASRTQRVKKTFDRARDRLGVRERTKVRQKPIAGFFDRVVSG